MCKLSKLDIITPCSDPKGVDERFEIISNRSSILLDLRRFRRIRMDGGKNIWSGPVSCNDLLLLTIILLGGALGGIKNMVALTVSLNPASSTLSYSDS